MPQTKLSVEGLVEARADLRAIDKTLGREVTKALRASAGIVASDARGRAPRRTGALAASIRPGVRGARAFVRSPLPYANPIHYGWPSRGIAAQPFIADAAEAKAQDALDRLADELDSLFVRRGFR